MKGIRQGTVSPNQIHVAFRTQKFNPFTHLSFLAAARSQNTSCIHSSLGLPSFCPRYDLGSEASPATPWPCVFKEIINLYKDTFSARLSKAQGNGHSTEMPRKWSGGGVGNRLAEFSLGQPSQTLGLLQRHPLILDWVFWIQWPDKGCRHGAYITWQDLSPSDQGRAHRGEALQGHCPVLRHSHIQATSPFAELCMFT